MGKGYFPSRDAARFGEFVGRLHAALADYVLVHHRRALTCHQLTEGAFDTIASLLGKQTELGKYLEGLRARVRP